MSNEEIRLAIQELSKQIQPLPNLSIISVVVVVV